MADNPIPFTEHAERVEQRRGTGRSAEPVRGTLFAPGEESELRTERSIVPDTDVVRFDYSIFGRRVGERAFAPPPDTVQLDLRRELLTEADHPEQVAGFLPDHLDSRVRPAELEPRFRPTRRLEHDVDPRLDYATCLFPPEDRFVFSDTSFPWCTCGKVDPSGASGVMVGPRHLLTVSHGINWHTPTPEEPWGADWVSFTPSSFDGDGPFGTAYSTNVYWQLQVTGPKVDSTEKQFDYVVVVLDQRIGERTGWMGSRSYTDDWDGGDYWSHIGYPADMASGSRPVFIGPVALDGDDAQDDAHEAMQHRGDVWPGQSGGPYFGWWDGEPWPRVVSVQSWERYEDRAKTIPEINGASGGSSMVDLIIRARTDFP
jgi:V8-like Glu-specific endopeptidase